MHYLLLRVIRVIKIRVRKFLRDFSLFLTVNLKYILTFAVLSQTMGMVPRCNSWKIYCKRKKLIRCQEKKERINRIKDAARAYMDLEKEWKLPMEGKYYPAAEPKVVINFPYLMNVEIKNRY